MLKRTAVLLSVVVFSISLSGCTLALLAGGAAAGGVGTAAWVSGKMVQEIDAPFEQTIQAAKSGLESLGLGITKHVKKQRVAQIMSNYTDGKTIWIDIHRLSRSASRIEIRVGMVSDKEAARRILNETMKYLE